ncbi:Methyltransferase domain-containing protein [Thalassobacillus cyri]|uniref:Methyltransferase domain-containing protein n=1 Tax=Thalassobacillus cyri TaxID=571932 RepID=A0A1H4FTN7_9BACI|nr:methyltransferase domain-containing protein [Thalassobacillus cyri]SEB00190.1 Methyltransferase domain-containing protein [Thalassobacillus cyri]
MAGKMFSHEKAEKLLDPKRQETVPVEEVIRLLDLNGDEKVIELGAGNGYLTIPIAKETSDRVTAVDIQPEMLEMLAERSEEAGIANIDRMPSGVDRLNFPDGSFQRAVAAFVLHEVPKLDQTLQEVYRILPEHGMFVVLDWEKVEGDQGPPLHERIPSQDLAHEVEQAGFSVKVGKLNKDVYFIVATK